MNIYRRNFLIYLNRTVAQNPSKIPASSPEQY